MQNPLLHHYMVQRSAMLLLLRFTTSPKVLLLEMKVNERDLKKGLTVGNPVMIVMIPYETKLYTSPAFSSELLERCTLYSPVFVANTDYF